MYFGKDERAKEKVRTLIHKNFQPNIEDKTYTNKKRLLK